MDYKTTQFNYYLDESYFHPERDKEFASETEKNLARKAMELLWSKESIKVNLKIYFFYVIISCNGGFYG